VKLRAFFEHPRTYLALRLAVGALFVAASVDKALHPEAFARIVASYQIVPDALVNLAAAALPWIELAAGVCLLAGRLVPGAALLAALLLGAFWASLVFDWARGLDIDCGCFSTAGGGGGHMAWYVLRDGFFLVLAMGLLATTARRQGTETDLR